MDLPYLDAMTNIDEQDWRKLCELAANETDPGRLRALVEQLSKALESRTKKLGPTLTTPKIRRRVLKPAPDQR
jgi:hypothetical protein